MKLPQHPALSLLSVAVLAYLCGDIACAVMERQFNARPPRLQQLSFGPGVPLNGLKLKGELQALLTAQSTSAMALSQPGTGGNVSVTQANATVAPPTAANATMPLPALQGTLEGSGQSLAVLQSGQETKLVAVGEEWMGYKVVEVGAFQARLRDARNQEFLISMSIANTSSTNSSVAVAPAGSPGAFVVNNTTALAGPQPFRTSAEIRAAIDNKAAWVKNILVQPELRAGESIGIKVQYTNVDNPFARLGIQTGDVVMSLNNKPARGVDDLNTVLMELRNSTNLNFQIERNGQIIPVQVMLDS